MLNTPMSGVLESGRIKELEKDVLDLKITNRGKDYFIEQLQKERNRFDEERKDYVEKLMFSNRKVGELETKLLQIESRSRLMIGNSEDGGE